MQNGALTEADKREISKAWDFSKYSRESIEGQLIGGNIVAVYPLFGADYSGGKPKFYSAGLAIVYQQPGNPELKTLEITTQDGSSRDDETTFSIAEGYLAPEPLFLLEGIK